MKKVYFLTLDEAVVLQKMYQLDYNATALELATFCFIDFKKIESTLEKLINTNLISTENTEFSLTNEGHRVGLACSRNKVLTVGDVMKIKKWWWFGETTYVRIVWDLGE